MGIISNIVDFYFGSKKDDLLVNMIYNKAISDESFVQIVINQGLLISNKDFISIFKNRSLLVCKILRSNGFFRDINYSTGMENILFAAIATNDVDKIKFALDLNVDTKFINDNGDNAILYSARKAYSPESLLEILKLLCKYNISLNFVARNKENIFSIVLSKIWYNSNIEFLLYEFIIDNSKVRFVKSGYDFVPLMIYVNQSKVEISLKKYIISLLVGETSLSLLFVDLNISCDGNIPTLDQWRIINKKSFNFFNVKSLDLMLLLFFGKKSKSYRRIFIKKIINGNLIDYDFLIAASCLKKFVVDDNFFIDYLDKNKNEIKESAFIQYLNSLDYDNVKLLDGLVSNLGVKRFFNFFITVNFHHYYYSDLMYMYNRIQTAGGAVHFSWKKPNSIIELHEKMQKEIHKFKSEEFELNQSNIVYLNEIEYNQSYSFYVPKTNIELIECGLLLNFCLGNGSYAKEVFNSKIKRIIFLKKQDKIEGAIYFNIETLYIIEAKLKNNRRMDAHFTSFIEKEITKHYQKNNIKVKEHRKEPISIISGFFV